MAKKKAATSTDIVLKDITAVVPLPQELAEAKVNPKNMKQFQEKVVAHFAPGIMIPLMEQLRLRVIEGDLEYMEMAAKILSLLGSGNGGFSITNNIIQSNTTQNTGPAWSFDAAARRGAERRAALQAPVIDVEPVAATGD